MNKIIFTIDVEPDLHTGKYLGITQGLKKFENIADKYRIKPILFVTANCIQTYPKIFERLHKKGWEISLHGFSHKRFDEMSSEEKEKEIKDSLANFQKYLKIKPKGFRAPQHSIDNKTLDLLEKYGFEYDSSYTPLNLLQLFFFPKKVGIWLKHFFSKPNPYKIRKNLYEHPCSALFIPFVSLTFRIFPKRPLIFYINLLSLIYKNPICYFHSWDFIEVKNSKTERFFNHERITKSLSGILEHERKTK